MYFREVKWMLPLVVLALGCRPEAPEVGATTPGASEAIDRMLPPDAGPDAKAYPHMHNLMQ